MLEIRLIKIFRGEGVVDGEGGGSERCLKWGGGGWWGVEGVIKGSLQNILNRGWVKAKVVRRGEGVLKVSPPLPSPENFNHHLCVFPRTNSHAQCSSSKCFIAFNFCSAVILRV